MYTLWRNLLICSASLDDYSGTQAQIFSFSSLEREEKLRASMYCGR